MLGGLHRDKFDKKSKGLDNEINRYIYNSKSLSPTIVSIILTETHRSNPIDKDSYPHDHDKYNQECVKILTNMLIYKIFL